WSEHDPEGGEGPALLEVGAAAGPEVAPEPDHPVSRRQPWAGVEWVPVEPVARVAHQPPGQRGVRRQPAEVAPEIERELVARRYRQAHADEGQGRVEAAGDADEALDPAKRERLVELRAEVLVARPEVHAERDRPRPLRQRPFPEPVADGEVQ